MRAQQNDLWAHFLAVDDDDVDATLRPTDHHVNQEGVIDEVRSVAQGTMPFPVEGVDDDRDARGDSQDDQTVDQPAQTGREPTVLLVHDPDPRRDRNRGENHVTKHSRQTELDGDRVDVETAVFESKDVADGRQQGSDDSETSKDPHTTEIASVHGFLQQRFSDSCEQIRLTKNVKKVKLNF